MSNFYITYFAKKHKKFITRKGQLDKPDGTQGKNFCVNSFQSEVIQKFSQRKVGNVAQELHKVTSR